MYHRTKIQNYVSRGGEKLESLLRTGVVDVKNKVCFDIGSSTGGFVDCLLNFGVKKVYCCDVGRGLLHYKLRTNPRIVLFEDVNFRYFIELGFKEQIKDKIDIFTVDVSFISLEKIFPVICRIEEKDFYIISLVKPQFECPKEQVKKGVVKEESYRLKAVEKIVKFSLSLGLKEIYRMTSPFSGERGNIEYFLVLKK